MGIDAYLKTISGETTQVVGDPRSELMAFLRSASLSATVCLRFIDPFGNTTFNRPQCQVLLAELTDLRKHAAGPIAEHLDRLCRITDLAARKGGYEIRFEGD
jgi:hypothetical protein